MKLFRYSLLIMLLTIGGCTPPPENSPNSTASPAAAKVTTELKSWDEFQAWVKMNEGQIVVVDVWSTACGECIKEFPNFVAFSTKYKGKVVCGSLNIDYYGSKKETAESGVPRIEERLNKLKASTIANFVSTTPDEDVMSEIESAAIPVSLVYGTDSKLVKSFNNDAGEFGKKGFNYAKDISDFVDSLIAANEGK